MVDKLSSSTPLLGHMGQPSKKAYLYPTPHQNPFVVDPQLELARRRQLTRRRWYLGFVLVIVLLVSFRHSISRIASFFAGREVVRASLSIFGAHY